MVSQTSDTQSQTSGTVSLTEDARYRLLSNYRRRTVLRVVANEGAPLTLDELAGRVAGREDVSDEQEGVRISLHHVHLPKLEEAGLIEYDRTEKCVSDFRASRALLQLL